MRFTSTQANFKSGRLSPKLFNRVDTTQYRDGASRMERVAPMGGGGIDRMWGTRFHYNADSLTGPSENKMFSFSIGEISIVAKITRLDGVFEPNRIDVHFFVYPYDYSNYSSSTILPSGSIAMDVSQFEFAIVEKRLVLTHYSGLMMPFYFEFNDSGILTQVYVQGVGSTWGEVHPNVTEWNTANPGSPYNYTGLGLAGLPMTDIGEKGNLTLSNRATSGGYRTYDVTSTDPAVVTILQRSIELYLEALGSRNFGDGNQRSIIASANVAVTGTITNGVSVRTPWIYVDTGYDIFQHVGVTTVSRWAHSEFYENNWPRTVAVNEGRLVFGGTPAKPLSLFGSGVNNYRMFNQHRLPYPGTDLLGMPPYTGPSIVTDPYLYTIASKDDSRITFIQPAQALIVGTDKKEYVASGGDTILSALSVNIKPYTTRGSKEVSAISTGTEVFFVGTTGKSLIRFKYNSSNGSFIATDLSILFSDLLEGDRIKAVTWAAHIQALMIIMQSGAMYGLSIDSAENEQAAAFFDPKLSTVETACYVSVLNDQGTFLDKGNHIVYHDIFSESGGISCAFQQIVESGLDKSYVQIVGDTNVNAHLYLDRVVTMVCVDAVSGDWTYQGYALPSGITQGAVPIPDVPFGGGVDPDLAFTGNMFIIRISNSGSTDHVVEEITATEYAALLDSSPSSFYKEYFPTIEPENDDIFIIGITPPAAQVATMPVEAGQQWGTAQMGVKNIDTLGIRYYKTYSYEISSDDTNWQEVVVSDGLGYVQTGRRETKRSSNPAYDHIVYIRNAKPEPLTILGINMRGVSNDG